MTWLLVIARWTNIWASVLLASVFVFEFVVVDPPVRHHSGFSVLNAPNLFHKLAWYFWTAGIISSPLWLWTISASMTGVDLFAALNPEVWSTVLLGTQFGHLWAFRLAIALAFCLSLLARRGITLTALDGIPAALAALHLVSLAWAGHASAGTGAYVPIHLINDAVHLAVAAFWPGGLVPFAALLLRLLKSEHPALRGIAARLTRRFSTTSLLAVAALSITGLLNSVFLIGDIQAVFTTPYGRLLLAKLVLFAAMLCIGAWNLLVLKPKFATEVRPENVANQSLAPRISVPKRPLRDRTWNCRIFGRRDTGDYLASHALISWYSKRENAIPNASLMPGSNSAVDVRSRT
jgi:putative copper resistance protein D